MNAHERERELWDVQNLNECNSTRLEIQYKKRMLHELWTVAAKIMHSKTHDKLNAKRKIGP